MEGGKVYEKLRLFGVSQKFEYIYVENSLRFPQSHRTAWDVMANSNGTDYQSDYQPHVEPSSIRSRGIMDFILCCNATSKPEKLQGRRKKKTKYYCGKNKDKFSRSSIIFLILALFQGRPNTSNIICFPVVCPDIE